MKNMVGQTPRGKNFFVRESLIKTLYRRLDSGSNLYISAPRRMGKTAILRYLEDNPKDRYNAVYVLTQTVYEPEIYFRVIMDELLKSSAITNLKKSSNKISEFLDRFLGKFKKVSGAGFTLEFAERESASFFEEFKNFVKKIDDDTKKDVDKLKLVIMIDEFPQTVQNIYARSGKDEAVRFLQMNREIRQEATENVLFILTGSIGLPTLVQKLGVSQTINDLNVFEIEPFELVEARQFITQLFEYEKVPYEPDAIDYILNKLSWLSPYHIQLLVQEFSDEYNIKGKGIVLKSVDEAFDKITSRRNDANFAHYYERLKITFTENELSFAHELLKELSQQEYLAQQNINDFAEKYYLLDNYPFVLKTLEFDGYIFKTQTDCFRFTSPILKLWWRQYVC